MSTLSKLASVLRDQRGATAVEYGLILCFLVIAMITALNQFTNEAIGMWDRVATEVENAR